MIPLRLASSGLPIQRTMVVRLRCGSAQDGRSALGHDALLIDEQDGIAEFNINGFPLHITAADAQMLDGDIILLTPNRKSIHRLIRTGSRHNSLLVTEQCDQLCIMCSQPPKETHADFFEAYATALLLAPDGAVITITGGEPLLHKTKLFELLLTAKDRRPDLRFHVLTNGQHFEAEDMTVIQSLGRDYVLWGIPLYSSEPETHDLIVAKSGAFARLMRSFTMLNRCGARIELRTVLLKSNVNNLESLSFFVARQLSFIDFWAIMQLESIGFGRMNWEREFVDSSLSFALIGSSIDIASASGTSVLLYNFPLCTVPKHYQIQAVASISDWKKKYLEVCADCSARDTCAGFFEWHPKSGGYQRLEKQ